MHPHPTFLTPETATETVLKSLSPTPCLIITGQIGCGKTTLAKKLSHHLNLPHLHLDDFHQEPDPHLAATQAANRLTGGWIAEANVWQIPQGIWSTADLTIFLDYTNLTHYLRILRRCLTTCARKPTWPNIRHHMAHEWGHIKIIYRYANKNRAGWHDRGLNANLKIPVIRCDSPRAASRLVAHLGTS
ncbi:MAG: hypothetical protein FWD53_12595 [Phycisphaerales bacterium]|nr:hypothetical protein [Phycisphaerales bacterium]